MNEDDLEALSEKIKVENFTFRWTFIPKCTMISTRFDSFIHDITFVTAEYQCNGTN